MNLILSFPFRMIPDTTDILKFKNKIFFLPTDPIFSQHVTGNKQFILFGLIEMTKLSILQTLQNKQIWIMFLPLSQKQYLRHPTHSSFLIMSHINHHSWNKTDAIRHSGFMPHQYSTYAISPSSNNNLEIVTCLSKSNAVYIIYVCVHPVN